MVADEFYCCSGSPRRPGADLTDSITFFTTLVGDGCTGRFFALLKTNRQLPKILPPKRATVAVITKKARRGESGALAWLEDSLHYGMLKDGDILLVDAERCWQTQLMRDKLSESNIQCLVYPKALGAIMDPCDNAFHAWLRYAYAKNLAGKGGAGLEEKLRALFHGWSQSSETAIRGFMAHCGITAGQPKEVIRKLLAEGYNYKREWRDLHADQLAAYINFCKQHSFSEPDERASKRSRLMTPTIGTSAMHVGLVAPE